MLGTGLDASAAFDAVRLFHDLIYRKLHRADLLAFTAIDAFLGVNSERVLLAAHCSLQRAHRAKGAPCPGDNGDTKYYGNRCNHYIICNKDHANFVYHALSTDNPEDHETHQGYEDRYPDPHAPEDWGNLDPAMTYWAKPEINETPMWAEISAKPASSEGSNDHQAGEDQQDKVAKLGVKYAAYGYY